MNSSQINARSPCSDESICHIHQLASPAKGAFDKNILLHCHPFHIHVDQVIEGPTQIKEIFRDVEGASQIFAQSPQFDQDTTKSLMEVKMVKMMKMMKIKMSKMINKYPTFCHYKSYKSAYVSSPSGRNISDHVNQGVLKMGTITGDLASLVAGNHRHHHHQSPYPSPPPSTSPLHSKPRWCRRVQGPICLSPTSGIAIIFPVYFPTTLLSS